MGQSRAAGYQRTQWGGSTPRPDGVRSMFGIAGPHARGWVRRFPHAKHGPHVVGSTGDGAKSGGWVPAHPMGWLYTEARRREVHVWHSGSARQGVGASVPTRQTWTSRGRLHRRWGKVGRLGTSAPNGVALHRGPTA